MGVAQLATMPLFCLLCIWGILLIKKIIKKHVYSIYKGSYKRVLSTISYLELYSKLSTLIFIIIVYGLAMAELLDYCEETFNSKAIAIVHIVVFIISIIFLATPCGLLFYCIKYDYDDDDDDDDEEEEEDECCSCLCLINSCNYFATIMIFTCLGYFSPYVVIAFIQDPLYSSFLYVALCLLIILVSFIPIIWLTIRSPFTKSYVTKFLLGSTVMFAILAMPYIFFMLISLFTLGSFSDFNDLKNIILPLLSSFIASSVGIAVVYTRKQI